MSKADDYNRAQLAAGKITPAHLTELGRSWQHTHGLDVDGFIGVQTIKSLNTAVDGRPSMPAKRCFPMRALADGRKPLVTSRYYTNNPSRANPDRPHRGVDLFYKYDAAVDGPIPWGDGGREGAFFVPFTQQAIAAADGVVADARFTGGSGTGFRLWILHGNGYASGYFHLKNISVKPGAAVVMGDPLGTISHNPIDTDARHLHFEFYWGDLLAYPKGSLDPELLLNGASILPA